MLGLQIPNRLRCHRPFGEATAGSGHSYGRKADPFLFRMQFFTPVPMNRAVVYPNEEHCWLIDIEPFFLDQNSPPVLDNQIGMDSERLAVLFQISQKGTFWNAALKPVTEQQWQQKKSFSFANIVSALKWSSVAQHRATCWCPYQGPEPGPMEINGKTPTHFNGVQSNCLVLSQAQFLLISVGFLHTPGASSSAVVNQHYLHGLQWNFADCSELLIWPKDCAKTEWGCEDTACIF